MAVTKQLNVFLPNKPGKLSMLCGAFSKAKINIKAISVSDTIDHGVVRLVTDKNARARTILKKKRIAFSESPVILVKMPNTIGALAKAAGKLAQKAVNIEYLYGSTNRSGDTATIIMRVSDEKKAEAILK